MAPTPRDCVFGRYRAILRHRPLQLLWGNCADSSLGDHFSQLALLCFTCTTSKSSQKFDPVAVISQVTYLVLGPVVGTLANASYVMTPPAVPAYVHRQIPPGAWAYGLAGSFQLGGGRVGTGFWPWR